METSRKGLITLNGFLSKWAYTTAMDPRTTLAYALYLGCAEEPPLDKLFAISRPRRAERRGGEGGGGRRGVLQCFLFAGEGVEVGGVLEGLIAQARPVHGMLSVPVSAAVGPVSVDGSSATLIIRAFGEDQAGVLLESPQRGEQLSACDVAAFVFDGKRPETFRAAVQQMVGVASASGDTMPCVFVGTNDAAMSQALLSEIGAACSSLAVKPPENFGGSSGGTGGGSGAELYQNIVRTAWQPDLAIPETPSLKVCGLVKGLGGGGVRAAGHQNVPDERCTVHGWCLAWVRPMHLQS